MSESLPKWAEHLRGLAKLEDNIGKRVAFETSAQEIDQLQSRCAELEAERDKAIRDLQETVAKVAAKSRPAYDEQQRRIAALEAENAALRADAERYRYIRSNQVWHRFDEYSVVGAKFDYADDFQAAVMLDHHIDRRLSHQPAQSDPKCWVCERTDGELREQSDGGGYESPTLVCHGCFTPQDTGPTFDDLPKAQSEGE